MISSYREQTKPKPGAQINPAHTQGLVGYWLFNEGAGSRANDISGHGHHGTLVNMSPNAQDSGWVGSEFGSGLGFDSDDYVNCGDHEDFSFGTGDLTFAVTVLTTSSATILAIGRYSGGGNDYWMGLSSGRASLSISGTAITEPSATANDGRWHQIIGVRKNGVGYIYVDGVQRNSGACTSGASPSDALMIGKFGTGASYNWVGLIDNVRIYNRGLNAAEVKKLYHNQFSNMLTPHRWYVSAAPAGAIMNQFQNFNIGADLYNGGLIA